MSAITNYFSSSSHDSESRGQKSTPKKSTTKKSRSDRLQHSKFKPEWSKIFPCIYFKDGAMYCRDCQDAGLTNTFSVGCDTFLKDNIQKHIKTADHKRAIQSKAMKPEFEQGVTAHESDVTSALKNLYWMAKNNLPNSLYSKVNELLVHHDVESVTNIQKAKNAKYTSPDAISDFQEAMVDVVDEEIKCDLNKSDFFSVMLDESTDRSTEKTLMLYVRYLKNGHSVTRFLSVVELSAGTADAIFECVKSIFTLYKLPFQKCISIGTDGANVMTGIRSGVSTRFSQLNPYIIKSHCIAHRLALAASQAANSVTYLKKYQGTLNEIYKYYHYSCKHMSELKSMAVIFDKAEKKFQEVLVSNLQSRFPSQDIFNALSIFDPKLIPEKSSQALVTYGRVQVDFLCWHFGQDKGEHKALISEVHFREEWSMMKHVLAGYKNLSMGHSLSSLLSKDSFSVDYPNVSKLLSVFFLLYLLWTVRGVSVGII